MTSIGTVSLSNDMVWEDEFLFNWIDAEIVDTIAGGKTTGGEFLKSSERGRLITLKSDGGQGYQRKSVVDALYLLAKDPNKTYLLTIIHNAVTLTKTVKFRIDMDGGPVKFTPRNMPNGLQKTTAWYDGTIYLMVW